MGPLRFNLSRSGLSVSGGVRGARVNVGPRGTYITLGAQGFRYRKKLTSTPSSTSQPPQVQPSQLQPHPAVPTNYDGLNPDGFIATASVSQLIESSADELFNEVYQRANRSNWFQIYCVVALIGGTLLLCGMSGWLMITYAVFAIAAAIPIYRWDRDRRTARLIYDVDSPDLLERLAMANAVGQWFSQNQALWHIYYSQATDDWKRSGGANTLISRTRIHAGAGSLPGIELNIEPWCVPVGPQQLLFLPDRLVVKQGGKVAAIPYDVLTATSSTTRFIEEEFVPGDSRQVDTTWQYVNRSGGPDRRFNDNRQLPVMEYGRCELSDPWGLRIVLQSSNVASCQAAASNLTELARRAKEDAQSVGQQAGSGQQLAPQPAQLVPAPHHRTPSATEQELHPTLEPRVDPGPIPTASALEQTAQALAVVLRYLAVADRKIDDSEVAYAVSALEQYCASDADLGKRLATGFRSLSSDQNTVDDAIEVLRGAPLEFQAWVLELSRGLVNADGRVTPKERERLAELETALGVQ